MHDASRHRSSTQSRRLAWVLALTCIYLLADIIGGLLSNSLALLADAGHMLSDAAAFALSLFAMWAARRPAPRASTFGYHRAEILAALLNGSVLLVIALFIFARENEVIGNFSNRLCQNLCYDKSIRPIKSRVRQSHGIIRPHGQTFSQGLV